MSEPILDLAPASTLKTFEALSEVMAKNRIMAINTTRFIFDFDLNKWIYTSGIASNKRLGA